MARLRLLCRRRGLALTILVSVVQTVSVTDPNITVIARLGRRLDDGGRALLGKSGAGPMVSGWLLVAAVTGVAFFVDLLLLPLLAVVVIAMIARVGVRTPLSTSLLIASVLVGVASIGFLWWTSGLAVDAADTFTPVPPVVDWAGPVLLLLLPLSAVGVVASGLVAVAAERRDVARGKELG